MHTDLVIENLTLDGETLQTTPEHPFYTADKGFVAAGKLQIGELVRKEDGSYGKVTAIALVDRPQAMYNLTVDHDHTFFVGAGQWLVHNFCTPPGTGGGGTDPTVAVGYPNGRGTQTGTTQGNSDILRPAMIAAGQVPNAGDAAHHIVHSTHPNDYARKSREILGTAIGGFIDINDPNNGVFVVKSMNSHFNHHTYIEKVYERLNAVKSGGRDDIIKELGKIRTEIQAGTFFP